MVLNDRKYKNETLSLWRFGIISPLLHRIEGLTSQSALLMELAGRSWLHPSGCHVELSSETIRKWLYRYREQGLPGLENKTRSDCDGTQIPTCIMDALLELRVENPDWTNQLILNTMLERGQWNGRKPSRSTLYRFIKANNRGRNHSAQLQETRAFAFESFGQLWIADFMHGPKLNVGRKRPKTYLHAIMDDCSRYVVQARFCTAETVESLMSEFHDAVRRFGLPQRFYTDNGACYRSRQLKIVCARLGVQLVHTPPYRPQGRGKGERFFRDVRDQFLAAHKVTTLEALNEAFQRWLDKYHKHRHRILGCSPLEKRYKVNCVTKPLPEVAKIETMFYMERSCRVHRDGTIQLKKRIFEVPRCVPGSSVTVYFLPWDLSRVYYGDDQHEARELDRHANAQRFNHPQ